MYEQMEKYSVNNIPGKGYEVTGNFRDDIHDIHTRILFDYHTYQILEAEATTDSLPFPICQQGLDKIKNVVGLQAGPGFSRKIKETLMGAQGCIHLGEMVMNSMKAGLQAASREIPEWVEEEDYKQRWSLWSTFFKDSCIYFTQPDALENLLHKVHTEMKNQ
ncbi:MAG: DUF2889 domain-containing protein [Bacillota bacterium]|nr:DUF2889 domain-containing protein [Bacillota bacterium]